jgi:hypothetical protein
MPDTIGSSISSAKPRPRRRRPKAATVSSSPSRFAGTAISSAIRSLAAGGRMSEARKAGGFVGTRRILPPW